MDDTLALFRRNLARLLRSELGKLPPSTTIVHLVSDDDAMDRLAQAILSAPLASEPRPELRALPDDDTLYDVALQVTDNLLGDGTYADLNRNHPDPGVQAAITKAKAVNDETVLRIRKKQDHLAVVVPGEPTIRLLLGDTLQIKVEVVDGPDGPNLRYTPGV